VGLEYNKELLENLPPTVDPCGEKGEFHTFVYDGPIFTEPVRFTKGQKVLRDNRFLYIDLEPP
jgi:diphthamide synthase (EF-2-diphthine--ammonia ligase)